VPEGKSCGCPLTEAGFATHDGEFTPKAKAFGVRPDQLGSFASGFDNDIFHAARRHGFDSACDFLTIID
jgi:hypothetical protein